MKALNTVEHNGHTTGTRPQGITGGVLETPLETIRHEVETNFFGTLLVTRAFAPQLIANAPGAILNVASVLSWLHPIAFGTYSCSKAALWAQTHVVRDELTAHGVSVTALHVERCRRPRRLEVTHSTFGT
jgi:short-subunit dehydrogenase